MANIFGGSENRGNLKSGEHRFKRRVPPSWVVSGRPRPSMKNKARFDLGSSWNDLKKLFGR